jgi:hypothetical protein
MTNKHTPCPWHTDASKSFYVFAHGSLAEQAGVDNGPFICNASTQANARLIAAAPELLHALLDALPYVEDVLADPEQLACFKPGIVQAHARAIRAAIAKAEGK